MYQLCEVPEPLRKFLLNRNNQFLICQEEDFCDALVNTDDRLLGFKPTFTIKPILDAALSADLSDFPYPPGPLIHHSGKHFFGADVTFSKGGLDDETAFGMNLVCSSMDIFILCCFNLCEIDETATKLDIDVYLPSRPFWEPKDRFSRSTQTSFGTPKSALISITPALTQNECSSEPLNLTTPSDKKEDIAGPSGQQKMPSDSRINQELENGFHLFLNDVRKDFDQYFLHTSENVWNEEYRNFLTFWTEKMRRKFQLTAEEDHFKRRRLENFIGKRIAGKRGLNL